jgi:transcriptional regulator with XRE-family HTH domain
MEALRPSEVFAQRVREVREGRRWSQQDLADRLAAIGLPTDRATIARTETGARGVSLDDAVAYCAALSAQFVHLIVPIEGDVSLAVGSVAIEASTARGWLRGQWALHLPDADLRVFFGDVPEKEFAEMRGELSSDVAFTEERAERARARRDKDVKMLERLDADPSPSIPIRPGRREDLVHLLAGTEEWLQEAVRERDEAVKALDEFDAMVTLKPPVPKRAPRPKKRTRKD